MCEKEKKRSVAEICCGDKIKCLSMDEPGFDLISEMDEWLTELDESGDCTFPEAMIVRKSYNNGPWTYYLHAIDSPEEMVELPLSLYDAAAKQF